MADNVIVFKVPLFNQLIGAIRAGSVEEITRIYFEMYPAEKPSVENACQECGRDNPTWFADNEVWNSVITDRVGVLCPNCFIARAEAVDFKCTGWKLVPENWGSAETGGEKAALEYAHEWFGFSHGNDGQITIDLHGPKFRIEDPTDCEMLPIRKALAWMLNDFANRRLAESREPEKLNNAHDPLSYFLVTYGFDGNNHARQMLISCWAAARQYERKQPEGACIYCAGKGPLAKLSGALAESSLSSSPPAQCYHSLIQGDRCCGCGQQVNTPTRGRF